MANEYDPYREALVVERVFHWPEGLASLTAMQRRHVEEELEKHPEQASEMVYVRLPTGFRREISVTAEDVRRILSLEVSPGENAAGG